MRTEHVSVMMAMCEILSLLGRLSGKQLTVSPSKYGNVNVSCRYSATDVLPQPAGPVITQMCLCAVSGAAIVGSDVLVVFAVECCDIGSDGGVGGNTVGDVDESMAVEKVWTLLGQVPRFRYLDSRGSRQNLG